jgi:hypothetical protein
MPTAAHTRIQPAPSIEAVPAESPLSPDLLGQALRENAAVMSDVLAVLQSLAESHQHLVDVADGLAEELAAVASDVARIHAARRRPALSRRLESVG